MALKGVREAAVVAPADPEARRRWEFDQAIEGNRDQWGRPKIMLPDNSKEVGYRRASSYGAPLEDASALEAWKLRQVARGVSRLKDLQMAVSRSEMGLDSSEFDEQKASKKELDALCKQAMDAVGSGEKAVIGTGLHHVFEQIDMGKDPGHLDEQWRPDLKAYQELSRGFRSLSVELFVVQDDHEVAGTLDRAVETLHDMEAPDGSVLPAGTVLIGDIKTAQRMEFAGAKFSVQCWTYATATPYDPIEKVRTPWAHTPPNQDWAVIFHVASGSGQARLYWVDLQAAAAAADLVRSVYTWRNRLGKAMVRPAEENFVATCALATSVTDLGFAYERAKSAGVWSDSLKALFGARKKELVG
jgi:hypothetical protein